MDDDKFAPGVTGPMRLDGLDSPAARIELLMDLGPEVYGTDPETGERVWLRGAGLLSSEQVVKLLGMATR